MRALSIGVVALAWGCAHGPGLSAEAIESAYLQARKPACSSGDAACCAERANAARTAAGKGESAQAARLWDEVALACPARRTEAAAALATSGEPAAAHPPAEAGHSMNLGYRARLSPAWRLYWVAAAAGPRLLPSTGPVAATQPVEVEVQAIRFSGGHPGPLVIANRHFDLAFEPGATVTIEIAEAPSGLALTAHVDRVLFRHGEPITPRKPAPPPRLEKAREVQVEPLRVPLELGSLPAPALRLCLDRDGQLDTIRFLQPAHPRLAASLIDKFRDARHEPYRVNDLAVPSCQVIGPSRS